MEKSLYKVLVSNDAYADIDDAIGWYEAQADGLGFEFLARFNDARAFLMAHPLIYQQIERDFRRIRLSKFPYAVYFKVYEASKEVLVEPYGMKKGIEASLRKDKMYICGRDEKRLDKCPIAQTQYLALLHNVFI